MKDYSKYFTEAKLLMGWKLMWIALKGLDEVPTILSYDECIDWIYERLENPGPETETIIQLIIEKDDPEAILIYDSFV